MSVESTTTIAGLNALWPLGSDSKSEGDDHLRLIKSVLKAEFSKGGVTNTAETRNRIVNGAMQVSQENGNTAGATQTYYAVDQFMMQHNMTCTFTLQRVQVVTPNGSVNRLRGTVTVADASLAASDIAYLAQPIEGIRVADFGYGTAAAQQSILRFGFKGPAGTYSIAIPNSGSTRTYLANFTVSAGQANTPRGDPTPLRTTQGVP